MRKRPSPVVGRTGSRTRRHLPHIYAAGQCFFITWNTLEGIKLSPEERRLVLEFAHRFHGVRLSMLAIVVMPDHVHALLLPLEKTPNEWWDLGQLLKGIKGASARAINQLRGRTGPLWQDESYDHVIRNQADFEEKWNYIRLNPARAGLCDSTGKYFGLVINSYADGYVPKSRLNKRAEKAVDDSGSGKNA